MLAGTLAVQWIVQTDLVVKETSLHPIVGTNVLQDVPRKHLVELPADEGHDDGAERNDGRNGDEERPDVFPGGGGSSVSGQNALPLKDLNGRLNRIDLNSRID